MFPIKYHPQFTPPYQIFNNLIFRTLQNQRLNNLTFGDFISFTLQGYYTLFIHNLM